MTRIAVGKFGGSSVAKYPEKINEIIGYADDDIIRRYVVMSAIGKINPQDVKVTQMLLDMAASGSKDITPILDKYEEILAIRDSKVMSELEKILSERIAQRDNLTESEYAAALSAFGEEATCRLFAERYGVTFLDPFDFIVLKPGIGKDNTKGIYDEKASVPLIRKHLLDKGDGPFIIPGFYGRTKGGKIITFSRGGSDVTQAHIAAALDVDLAENFTDSPIRKAHPDYVHDSEVIKVMTHGELRNLTLIGGYEIIHKDALPPLIIRDIPLYVYGTHQFPNILPTKVLKERKLDPKKPIVGIGYSEGFSRIRIQKLGLNDIKGGLEKIFRHTATNNIDIGLGAFGFDDISFLVESEQISDPRATQEKMSQELTRTLGNRMPAEVTIEPGYSALLVVGEGMKGRVGMDADITSVLKDHEVNISMHLQASESMIGYGLKGSNHSLVQALYDRFIR